MMPLQVGPHLCDPPELLGRSQNVWKLIGAECQAGIRCSHIYIVDVQSLRRLSNAGNVLKWLQKSSNLFPPPGVAITLVFL